MIKKQNNKRFVISVILLVMLVMFSQVNTTHTQETTLTYAPFWGKQLDKSITDMKLLDVNNDSISEIVVASDNELILYTYRGVKMWAFIVNQTISNVIVLDYDGDGLDDLAISYGPYVSVLSGSGHLAFTVEVAGTIFDMTALDLDYDGRDDIVVSTKISRLTAIYSNGSLGWSLITFSPETLVLAVDFENDGKYEIAIASGSGTARIVDVYYGNSSEYWPYPSVLANPAAYMIAADVTGDNRSELIITDQVGYFYVYDRLASLNLRIDLGSPALSLSPLQADDDPAMEIVVSIGSAIRLIDGNFIKTVKPLSAASQAVYVSSFNPLGELVDYILYQREDNTVSVITVTGSDILFVKPFGTIVAFYATDFDGDGRKEMIFADSSNYVTVFGVDDDGDNLPTIEEVTRLGTNPNNPDTDGDSLSDRDEFDLGTDPLNPDTDGDFIPDGVDIFRGINDIAVYVAFFLAIVIVVIFFTKVKK